MSFFYLEITKGANVGKRYLLTDGAISVGRNTENTISFPVTEKSVSGHHAIIYKNPERIVIQDLQSTNGTFVNEIKTEEKELQINDEVGFGKSGPRLKLIKSEAELPLSNNTTPSFESTKIKTSSSQEPFPTPDDATSKEDQNTIFRLKKQSEQQPNQFQPSVTLEYEKKLIDNDLDSNDMNHLLKDGKRLEKIIERRKIDDSQSSLLKTVYLANKKMRQTLYYIMAAIIVLSVLVCSYFAIRTFQYKMIVGKVQKIQKDFDEYDKKIATVNQNPDQNKAELQKLINEMDQKQKDFTTLRSKLDNNDFGKIYRDPIEKQIDQILERYGESNYHIPTEMVDRVKYHIGIYSGQLHSTIGRYIQRKQVYFPLINRIFRENNIPTELGYVSMLESGFNPMALSHVGARGLWQFMPETGKRYGLTVSDGFDERINPEKATYAAAKYFKELIGIFGGKSSVMLCMAAYNAGEGRLIGALRKIDDPMRNRDFWYIYRMGYLAEETNEYIPRVIALMIISEHPAEYGFSTTSVNATAAPVESEKDFIEVDYRVQ